MLLKVHKMCAQSASLSIFPTDAFILKLVGIDVQHAEVTRKHMFKHTFAISGASVKIILLSMMSVNVL